MNNKKEKTKRPRNVRRTEPAIKYADVNVNIANPSNNIHVLNCFELLSGICNRYFANHLINEDRTPIFIKFSNNMLWLI